MLHYSFAPDTISGYLVSTMASAQFAGITGILQMGPTVINSQLILSSVQKQYLATATPFSTGSSGLLSIACWFRSTSDQVWARVFDLGNGPDSDNILVSPMGSSTGIITFLMLIGSIRFQYTLPGSYNDNIWRHVGWIFNPDGNWNIYINGMLMQQLQGKGYPNSILRSFNYLGRSGWTHDPYFSGEISDFRLYNRVLSAAEISALYSGTPTALPTAPQTFIATTSPTAPPTALLISTARPTPTPTSISTDNQQYLNARPNVICSYSFPILRPNHHTIHRFFCGKLSVLLWQ